MDERIEAVVTEVEAGWRLDRFVVARVPGTSRQRARDWLNAGCVRVDDRLLKKGDLVRVGQRVVVTALGLVDRSADIVDHAHAAAGRSDRVARVVFEDAHLVVIDKPAKLPSHGLRDDEPHTLTSQLVARYPEMRGVGYSAREPGILHRLDTETSGLMIAARTAESFARLRQLLDQRAIEKHYVALCVGVVQAPRSIESYLVSDRSARVKVSNVERKRSRLARTDVIDVRVVSRAKAPSFSVVTVSVAHAGRHQIRAHLASIGHALVGDALYGGPRVVGLDRHALHASTLRFVHPFTGASLDLSAALPDDIATCLRDLEKGAATG